MKLAAVICEFDPFHNGHRYLIEETRRRTGCDGVVCIMSGSFTQRGRPSICDKWTRAKMALSCGADIVIELPFVYVQSSAQFFALGGVAIARAINADVIAFGIETDSDIVYKTAELKLSPFYRTELLKAFREGESYPKAAASAGGSGPLGPNDILACEYVAASKKLDYEPEFIMINRVGVGHGRMENSDGFASAMAIREALIRGGSGEADEVGKFMPPPAFDLMREWLSAEAPVTSEMFSSALTAKIRTMPPESADALPFAKSGLGRLIHKNGSRYSSWEDIVRESTSKRYTSSRISRLLVWALTLGAPDDNMSEEELEEIYFKGFTPYARVLGIGGAGGDQVLSEVRKRCIESAFVTSPAEYLSGGASGGMTGIKMMKLDLRAQAVYNCVLKDSSHTAADRDFTEKFIRIRPSLRRS